MQSVSSRIWTRVAVSISYDDNHYATGTFTLLFVLSFETTIRYWMQIYTLNSGNVCMNAFLEIAPHSSIEEMLCFSVITEGHVQLELHKKKYWILASLFYSIYGRFPFFLNSQQNALINKNFIKKIRWKYLWKAQNQMNFTWKESTC